MTFRVYIPPEARFELRKEYSASPRSDEVEFDAWIGEKFGIKCHFENPGWKPFTFPKQPSLLFFEFEDERDAVKFKLEHLC